MKFWVVFLSLSSLCLIHSPAAKADTLDTRPQFEISSSAGDSCFLTLNISPYILAEEIEFSFLENSAPRLLERFAPHPAKDFYIRTGLSPPYASSFT